MPEVEGLDTLDGCANYFPVFAPDVILSKTKNPLNGWADSLPPLSSRREERGRWIAALRQDGRGKTGGVLGFPLWGNAGTTFKS
jgi:hypothetical protein